MARFKNFFYSIDFSVQFILLCLLLPSGMVAMFEQETILFFLLALFFTGTWQLFTAALWGILYKQTHKLIYFGCAGLYCLMLYLGENLLIGIEFSSDWKMAAGVLFVCVFPTLAACVYFWLTTHEPAQEELV